MKPILEKIQAGFGSSFTVREFSDLTYCNKPHWHFHPEYEIVYISHGRGKRHIGDHISYYDDGDLIFLGPNLPHFGFTEELKVAHVEIVVQMGADFLGREFFQRPEMAAIQHLFERAGQGLSFHAPVRRAVGGLLREMAQLSGFDRLIALLRVLQLLATTEEYTLLNAQGFSIAVNAQDHDRMRHVYDYVERSFQDEVSLAEVAKLVSMTVPAFCRYFKRLTNKTFTQFVNEFRVAHACRLLSNEHLSIAAVSFESGFNNLSHFNKQFRLVTGANPRDYRKNQKILVG